MKKIVMSLTSVLLIALMLVSLVSCGDKSEAIRKAFTKEDYKEATVNASNTVVKAVLSLVLTEDQMKDVENYEISLYTKLVTNAVVIKFKSAGEIKDFLTVEDKDGKKDTTLYDSMKESGAINGNCIFFGDNTALEIFKKA